MNLLETILCNSESEKYILNFKKYGIDALTLKLLNDEDLKLIGVEEEDKRSLILKHADNLQITAERQVKVMVDKKYIESVLLQMLAHLPKHVAAISIALNRKDVIICNLKVNEAVNCLNDCIQSLDKQLEDFEKNNVTSSKSPRKDKRILILIPTVVIATLTLVSLKTYPLFRKFMF